MALGSANKKEKFFRFDMKIYFAGGMTVMNVKGREREIAAMVDHWNRLHSFFFRNLWQTETIELLKGQ